MHGPCLAVYNFLHQFSCLSSWLCGGATGREHTWTSISGHSCGRYKEDHEKKAARAKKDLNRYIHYHNRYKAHVDSYNLHSKLKEAIKEKISELEKKESASKDFSWITNGLSRLSRARRILSLTYPFAYYMFDEDKIKYDMTNEEMEIKRDLFEGQQQQFEGNVEKLSSFLEEKFDVYKEDEIENMRMRIIAVSVSTDNLCRNL